MSPQYLIAAYKIDTFLEKILEDGKRLKEEVNKEKWTAELFEEEVKKEKRSTELFEEFLDGYNLGICLVGNEENIEYLNKKGLEIIMYNDFDEIRGKDFKETFMLNDINIGAFRDKFVRKDLSFDQLDVKLGDGSEVQIQASVTFKLGESGVQVSGIIFDQP